MISFAAALVPVASRADSYTNTVPPGVSLLAIQLDHGSNTADVIFPNQGGQLDGNVISKWNCSSYTSSSFDSTSPTGFSDNLGNPVPPPLLPPGEGFVFNNQVGGYLNLVITGSPHVPTLPPRFPCGTNQLNLLGRQTNAPGTYTNITGFSPQNGAQEQIWTGTGFTVYTFSNNLWSPVTPPALNVGVSAFFLVPSNANPCFTLHCPSNIVVGCGSAWSFTPPTATSCCGTNITITILSTTTNGVCPQTIIRTWRVSDSCNNSAICNQVVSTVAPTAPVLTAQPQDQTVSPGGTAVFEVAASGSAPLRYQWRFNGVPRAGATNSAYTISNVQSNAAGVYDVIVSNSLGAVTSVVANLWFYDWWYLFREHYCVVDITPNNQSGEFHQNAEPSLGVGSGGFGGDFVIHAFDSTLNNYYYTSTDGGTTWTSPGRFVDYDCTVDWSTGGTVNSALRTVYASLLPSTATLAARQFPGLPGTLTTIPAASYSPPSGATPDQPWVRVVNVPPATKGNPNVDHIYIGFNDLSKHPYYGGNGRTASVRYSLDSGASWHNKVVEAVNPGAGQDSPAIRLAPSSDGKAVYAVFQRWTSANGSDFNGDVVLVRDDNFAGTFGALGNGTVVAGNVRLPWGTALGAQRLGSGCDVAVHPADPTKVYVAYTRVVSVSGSYQPWIYLLYSHDSGATFTVVYVLDWASSLPALAVLRDGTVGMLFASQAGNNLEVDFLKFLQGNFNSSSSTVMKVLARFPNNSPARTYHPYIGDYFQLKANGYNFYGTFCASGQPLVSHFPSGVYYNRNVKDNASGVVQNNFWLQHDGTLVDLSSQPVSPSIDPFFFCDIAPIILYASPLPPLVPPYLVATNPGLQPHITWPVQAGMVPQIQLQSSPVLGPAANWTMQTSNVAQYDGQFDATLDLSAPPQFFRLGRDVAGGQFQIRATADGNGDISPSGLMTTAGLSSATFTATPSNNYAVANWYLDGQIVQSNTSSLTLSNLDLDHSVSVSFAPGNDIAVSVVAQSMDPEEPLSPTNQFTYEIQVANMGLNPVTSVTMMNVLDPTVSFVSATTSQGSVNNSGNLVTADLGTLNPGDSASISLLVVPTSDGVITDSVSVACAQFEPNLDNNSATIADIVLIPPVIITQPTNQTAMSGGTASFSVAANGTPPFTYQWRLNGTDLPSATDATLTLTNVTTADAGSYSAAVFELAGPESMFEADSQAATLTITGPVSSGGPTTATAPGRAKQNVPAPRSTMRRPMR